MRVMEPRCKHDEEPDQPVPKGCLLLAGKPHHVRVCLECRFFELAFIEGGRSP